MTWAVAALGTRRVTRPSSCATTSPKGERSTSPAPSSSSTTIVLWAEKRCTSPLRGPSKRSRPWWITSTRLQRASTSAM